MNRVARCMRWIGAAGCLLVVILWAVACFYDVSFYITSRPRRNLQIEYGLHLFEAEGIACDIKRYEYDKTGVPAGFQYGPLNSPAFRLSGFRYGKIVTMEDDFGSNRSGRVVHRWLRVPFWFILVGVAVPTAVLFWRVRKPFPPGHCRKCGYDLTGNVTDVCSECGEAIPTTS